MNRFSIVAALSCVALLSACQEPGSQGGINKQQGGAVLGGIAGGVLGSTIGKGSGKTAATIGGAVLGGVLGSSIGESLDKADQAYYNQTVQRSLETAPPGRALPWSNPESGNSGSVTPSSYYKNGSGQYCREYTQTIVVGGKKQTGNGTACRQPDGTWQIVQ